MERGAQRRRGGARHGPMMLISRRSDIMGAFVIGWPLMTLGWVTTALMGAAAAESPCWPHENVMSKIAIKSAPSGGYSPIGHSTTLNQLPDQSLLFALSSRRVRASPARPLADFKPHTVPMGGHFFVVGDLVEAGSDGEVADDPIGGVACSRSWPSRQHRRGLQLSPCVATTSRTCLFSSAADCGMSRFIQVLLGWSPVLRSPLATSWSPVRERP